MNPMSHRRQHISSTGRAWRIALSALLAAGLAVSVGRALAQQQPGPRPPPAAAAAQQQEGTTTSAAANHLNPFPENDVWRALVIGDHMAEGLLAGLTDAMRTEGRIQIQRTRRPLATLTRADLDDDMRNLVDMMGKEKIHIAIIMMGMSDRFGLRAPNGRRLPPGSDEWRTQYGQRVDRVLKALRQRGISVYWVGLPIMRRQDWNDDNEAMNAVYRERAGSNGSRFVSVFKEMADENGAFSDRGPDITGKLQRLRDPDGTDFTPAGYRKLAFFIERELKRDMATARNERAIPLAGSEAEQRLINPEGAKGGAAGGVPGTGQPKAPAKAGSPVARTAPVGPATPAAPPADTLPADQRAENVKVSFKAVGAGGKEETITLDIVRPALSTAVVSLVTRRDKGDKPSQMGDTLTDTLSNGLLVMRSVTPTSRDSDSRPARSAATSQPFFIALVRGERLPPKPGRADDLRWPREDDLPPLPVAAGPAPITSPVPLKQTRRGQRR